MYRKIENTYTYSTVDIAKLCSRELGRGWGLGSEGGMAIEENKIATQNLRVCYTKDAQKDAKW